ncbi:putative low-complexity protein [Leptolyngbya sp. PCC 7375]|nr:putative low-complexity protein [Leptolyngbya sp. PCC 7375]
MQPMVLGITQWLWHCRRHPVALAGVTLLTMMFVQSPIAQALDENDLKRLLETNECPGCNLEQADLRRLDLTGANLEGANLRDANLFYAVLDGANLKGADLSQSNLAYVRALTILTEVTDSEGNFLEFPAQFVGADLEGALLTYADFSGAEMMEANFSEAYINKTQFVGAQLQHSNFVGVIHDVDLTGANLCGATYWGGIDYRRACNVPVPDLVE